MPGLAHVVERFVRRARRAGAGGTGEIALPPRPAPPTGSTRLLVGPANFAGQGWAWGRAAERLPGVGAQVFAVDQAAGYAFPADYPVTAEVYRSPRWAAEQEAYVLAHFTHVLIEAGRPVLGLTRGIDAGPDAALLADAGLTVAMVAHGSDVRLPSRHVGTHPWSPFRDPAWDQVPVFEQRAARFGAVLTAHAASGGAVFVSTPDLLADVPGATWLPSAIEPLRWACPEPPLRRRRPVVVHAPSNPRFKGTALVEPLLHRLAGQGLIDYRRVGGVPNAAMPGVIAEADVVLDQFALGIYSVAAVEAMAAGRVVVAHVDDAVRAHVRTVTGRDLPVVEATVDTLGDVLADLVRAPDAARARAAEGVGFAREVHDGRRSAAVLAAFLGCDRLPGV